MIPADEKGHEPDTHTGKCVLDLDNTGNWLVCTLDPTHQMNLKSKVNRKTALRSLYDAGLLRPDGWAEREVRGVGREAPAMPAPADTLFGRKEDGDEN